MAPSNAVQPAAGTSSNAAPLIVIIHPRSDTTAAGGSPQTLWPSTIASPDTNVSMPDTHNSAG